MKYFTEAICAHTSNSSDTGEAELSWWCAAACPPSDSELIDATLNELRWNNAALSCLEKLQQALVGANQRHLFDGKSGRRHWTASSASPCDRLGRRLRVSGGKEMDRGERHYKHFILCTIALQLSTVTV